MKKILRLSKRLYSLANPNKPKLCSICNSKVSDFLPLEGGWKNVPALVTALEMVGSDVDNFTCPNCQSHDRERHQWLYWQQEGIPEKMRGANILHFAPEHHLNKKIQALQPSEYILADLYPTRSDIQKVDIHSMPFTNDHFDFVIVNHVLEHVEDDRKAVAEIKRVLKPKGSTILQTPYSDALHTTWEDEGISSEEQRLHAYGQEDHVRLFGKDIFQRIAESGLTPHIHYHEDILTQQDSTKYGVNKQEPFMLFKKASHST